MDATVDKNDLNKSFCIATQDKGTEWPKGEYSLFKQGLAETSGVYIQIRITVIRWH